MFCPQCGLQQGDELRFCKACGANLNAVRHAVASGGSAEGFDWGKTWVAEMFLSEAERKRRKAEEERARGLTPEVKRYNEVKAGVITSGVGVGVAIFLYVISEGIILGGKLPPDEVEIIRRIWVVGVIPFLVGLALIINGLFVSRKIVEAARREQGASLPPPDDPRVLRPADTSEFIPADFSVTEGTTRHLETPARGGETR
jgi:hypothetical protein